MSVAVGARMMDAHRLVMFACTCPFRCDAGRSNVDSKFTSASSVPPGTGVAGGRWNRELAAATDLPATGHCGGPVSQAVSQMQSCNAFLLLSNWHLRAGGRQPMGLGASIA